MALDKAVIYATYEDDGRTKAGAQDSSTFPQKVLMIFPNMSVAKEFESGLKEFSNIYKNPRITAFYSQDADEVLVSCWPAKVVGAVKYVNDSNTRRKR
jgi:hypothetical protein